MSRRALLAALSSSIVIWLALLGGVASAEGPVYSISGFATIGMTSSAEGARGYGGGGILEAHFLDGPLRVGPAIGSHYISEGAGGLIITPLLAAASLELGNEAQGGRLLGGFRARGGVAPIVTGDGFGVGGLFTLGATIEYRVDEIVAIGLGLDAHLLLGRYARVDLAPLLTLSLRP